MNNDDDELGKLTAGAPFVPKDAEDLADSLKRREQAADALEDDLLNDVPMLYGPSAGLPYPTSPVPDILIGRIHREEMLRKNGYDVSDASGTPSEVSLPFERPIGALVILLVLIVLFSNATQGR